MCFIKIFLYLYGLLSEIIDLLFIIIVLMGHTMVFNVQ